MKLWKIMAMLCVCASSVAQVQLGRNVQIGGAGSGGPCPVGPNGSVQYSSSGACAGSAQFITDSQGNVQIEGGTNGSGTLEVNSAFGSGGWLMNESHLTLNSHGGNGATGGIDLLVDDSHYTGSATGLVPMYINCDVTRANKNCIGIEVQSSAEANGTHMTGFESDTPSFGAFTAATSWRYLALTAGQGRAAEEIGYLVTSTISPTDSGYCDFWARNNDGSGTRVKLGCGSTSANTFTGPTTVGDLTITGTCTGCGSGTLTGSGTIGYLPLWTPTTTALGNSNIDDGVTTASTLTTHEALTVADGTGKAGFVGLKQGTAQSTAANSIGFTAPTSVTAYNMTWPAAQWTGLLSNNGSGVLSGVAILPVANGGTGTATPALVAGTNVTITGTWPNQTINSTSTASTAFSALTGSTNTTAAMVVGSGASLAPTGTGTIQATNIASTISAGTNVTITGSGTTAAPYVIASSGGGTNPLYFNWAFNTGAAATDASPRFLASHAGTISTCYVLTTASDGATALTLNIFDNGTSIFSGGAQTVAAGTAAGTLTTLGSLTSTPLSIANNDKISINITSGTASWIFTVQCK